MRQRTKEERQIETTMYNQMQLYSTNHLDDDLMIDCCCGFSTQLYNLIILKILFQINYITTTIYTYTHTFISAIELLLYSTSPLRQIRCYLLKFTRSSLICTCIHSSLFNYISLHILNFINLHVYFTFN